MAASQGAHPMFRGLTPREAQALAASMGGYVREYEKGEYVVLQGDKLKALGLLLSGRVFVEKEDVFGKNFLYAEVRRDTPWGFSFLYPSPRGSDVSCRVIRRSAILFIPYERLSRPLPQRDWARQRFLENLFELVVRKNRMLMEKINILSRKSLRERIWLYFRGLMRSPQDVCLFSSLNRTEMAKFLCVNRSALSRELSQMEREGLLKAERNMYTILHPESVALLRSPPLLAGPPETESL